MDLSTLPKYFWLYIPEKDEAGCVAPGFDAEDALREAKKIGFSPDPGDEIQIYELGDSTVIYEPEEGDEEEIIDA